MMIPRPRVIVSRQPLACLLCRWRGFSTSGSRMLAQTSALLQQPQTIPPPVQPAPLAQDKLANLQEAPSPFGDAPRSYGKRSDATFVPKPLARPIGMPNPPQPGENTGKDSRSLRQRRADLADWEKHVAKRKDLTAKMARPYYRDWHNMQWHKGKSFLAPPRLFRADLSLFFPNLFGRTLSKKDRKPRDTTPTLLGKASVVTFYSSAWAERQAQTHISDRANPALRAVLDANPEVAQLVQINHEDNTLKAWVIQLFMGSLRRRIGGPADWEKYFLVRTDMPMNIRESIGLLNSKVAYIYLVDSSCRIRWAASGLSNEEERASLAKGLQKLLNEMKTEAAMISQAKAQAQTQPAQLKST